MRMNTHGTPNANLVNDDDDFDYIELRFQLEMSCHLHRSVRYYLR